MKTKRTIISSVIGLALVAGISQAAEPKSGPREDKPARQMRADKDGNGTVDKAEFLAEAETRFQKTDANADGNIDREEMKAQRQKMRKHFKGKHRPLSDKNGDGKVTIDDVPERAKELFAKVDTDSNGEVSETERKAFHEKMKECRGGDCHKGDAPQQAPQPQQ